MNGKYDNEIIAIVWALDFTRAVADRPLIYRLLFRLIIGKYAIREFYGLIQKLREIGYAIEPGWYGLEECEYQKDKIPWKWW
jgi:hypothetical protein